MDEFRGRNVQTFSKSDDHSDCWTLKSAFYGAYVRPVYSTLGVQVHLGHAPTFANRSQGFSERLFWSESRLNLFAPFIHPGINVGNLLVIIQRIITNIFTFVIAPDLRVQPRPEAA